jgi:hypothetical protein
VDGRCVESNGWIIFNDTLRMTWKVTVMGCSDVFCNNLREGLSRIHENFKEHGAAFLPRLEPRIAKTRNSGANLTGNLIN